MQMVLSIVIAQRSRWI